MSNDDNQTPPTSNEEPPATEDSAPDGSAPDGSTTEGAAQEQATSCAARLGDEIKEAKQCCDNMRRKAVERLQNARSTTLGDVLDGTMAFVKRHPQCSLGIAATLGFFIARIFRR